MDEKNFDVDAIIPAPDQQEQSPSAFALPEDDAYADFPYTEELPDEEDGVLYDGSRQDVAQNPACEPDTQEEGWDDSPLPGVLAGVQAMGRALHGIICQKGSEAAKSGCRFWFKTLETLGQVPGTFPQACLPCPLSLETTEGATSYIGLLSLLGEALATSLFHLGERKTKTICRAWIRELERSAPEGKQPNPSLLM